MTDSKIRLLSLEAENLYRLKVAKITLDGTPGVKVLTSDGENGQGKTSTLLTICALLGGDGAVKPDAIHEDSVTGSVTGEFSNGFRVERRFTEASPKGYLDVIGPDNMTPQKKQAFLNNWVGRDAFDPSAVFGLNPKKLREVLLDLSSVPGLRDKLDGFATRRNALKEERKPFNVEKQRAERTPRPEGDRPVPVDTSEVMAKLKELNDVADVRGSLIRGIDDEKAAQETHTGSVDYWEGEVGRIQDELDEAQDRLAQKKKAKMASKGREKELAAELKTFPDPAEDIQAAHDAISGAQAAAKALRPWDAWDTAQADLKVTTKAARGLTARLNELDAEESSLMAEAKIPVPGISFMEDGTPLLNGKDLAVASGRERIDMALDIGFARNPKLPLILLDEANDLSLTALKALDGRAKKKDFVVIACRLGLEGPGEIVVTDGVARNFEEGGPQ